MTPVHCVSADHEVGDCYRASLASILNVSPYSVPHFGEIYKHQDSFHEEVDQWLGQFGFTTANMVMHGDTPFEEVARLWNNINPGVPAILSGVIESGAGHSIVMCDGDYFNPSTAQITGPFPPEGQSEGGWWISTVAVAHNFNPKGIYV